MKQKLFLTISMLFVASVPVLVLSAPLVGEAPQGAEDRFLSEGDGIKVEAWIQHLEIPWSLVFLPDGRALVSARTLAVDDGEHMSIFTHGGEGGQKDRWSDWGGSLRPSGVAPFVVRGSGLSRPRHPVNLAIPQF